MASRGCRWIVTGGIGSGKSAVTSRLRGIGADVIDADEVGKSLLEPAGLCFAEVATAWPEVVVRGEIDRRALAGIVFNDLDELRRLEAITHPHVRDEITRWAAESLARLVAVELSVPMVVPGSWTWVVVDVPTGLRVRRLLGRGMDSADVEARMSAQPKREKWLAQADHVLDNSGDLAVLEAATMALVRRLCPAALESGPYPI